jgi:formyltetrahydrofolate-dependent phosphoribosylglycinamide formyltransferase
MVKLAAFASGRGSNFQAILNHLTSTDVPARYALLISDRVHPGAADLAQAAGIPFVSLNPKGFSSPEEYTHRLISELERFSVEWITLAGYLKMIPGAVVQLWRNRILNIHPALLPSFGGPGMYGERVHQAVIESGVRISGASVHLVDEQYDHGAIIMQQAVPVFFEDTVETLAHRVLKVEHTIYPLAVELAVTDKIRVHERRVEILP